MYDEIKIETDNTLAHHGILGMKWGVRRTPEQLGYRNTSNLTKARAKKIRTNAKIQAEMIKRQGKNQAKIEKAEAKAKAVTDKAKEKYDPETKRANADAAKASTAPQKSIKEMSDDEIMQKIDRLRLEKTLKMTMKELAAMEPPVPENKIKKFVSETMNDVVKPAATQAGKKLLQDWMEKEGKDLLGLNQPVKKTLDQQVDELRKKKEIKEIQDWFATGGKKEKTLQEQAADRMAEKRLAEVDDWFNKRAANAAGTTESKPASSESKQSSEPTKPEASSSVSESSKPSGGLKLKSEPASESKASSTSTTSKSKYSVPEYEKKMDDISLKKYDSPGKKAFKQELKDLEAKSDAEYAAKKSSSNSSSKTSSSGTSYSYDSNKSTSSNGKSYVELLTGSVEGRGSNGGRSEYQLPAVVNTNSNQYALAASSGRTYATYLLEKKR